jgi:O-antigen ligase
MGGGIGSIIAYYLCSKKPSNSYWIFFGYILLLASTIYYLHTQDLLITLDSDSERLEDELVNANDLAYYLFYVTIGWTIICCDKKLKTIFSILGNVVIISTLLFLSIITASRQILMVVLPFYAYSIYFQYLQGRGSFRKILVAMVCCAAAFYIYSYFMDNMFEGSFLEKRMEIDIEDDTRGELLEDAINVGIHHPIFGVGPGNMIFYSNDGEFSHNSYLELFATSGIFGSILFICMIISFLKIQVRRYRETRNPMYLYLIVTMLTWALYNNLYVFYSGIWLITFFFVLCGFSDATYRRYCEQMSECNENLLTAR